MQVALCLGPLSCEGFIVRRSGFRWLCEDGRLCQPGETIAYCNIKLQRTHGAQHAPDPFAEESRDFQVALSTPVGGRLHHQRGSSKGGFFDQLELFSWDADFSIGSIEVPPGGGAHPGRIQLGMLMLAGRRATEVAEVRSGLLTGWHVRSRAWKADSDGPVGTLLSLGICELEGVIKGERSAFLEIFDQISGPAQVVFIPDPPLVPNARFLAEKITRTADQFDELSRNMTAALAASAETPSPEDWIFVGSMLQGLQTSPITDRYTLLTRSGLRQTGPADAVVLSLNAETTTVLRHRQLGYTCWFHNFRLADIGRPVLDWLRASFELVRRSADDIADDYRRLIDLIRERAPATRILICNRMSTDGADDIQSYAAFDMPLWDTLPTVQARQLNLMLHDLARERDIAVIDVDAIAAELGARGHLQLGAHQSGVMQAEIRQEILGILRAGNVPGFGLPD